MSGQNTRQKKKRLRIEQGGLCFICKQPMAYEDDSIEHVVPLKNGRGTYETFQNMVLAHYWCNHAKGGRKATKEELMRLLVLKRRYAEVDYAIGLLRAETQTEWLDY